MEMYRSLATRYASISQWIDIYIFKHAPFINLCKVCCHHKHTRTQPLSSLCGKCECEASTGGLQIEISFNAHTELAPHGHQYSRSALSASVARPLCPSPFPSPYPIKLDKPYFLNGKRFIWFASEAYTLCIRLMSIIYGWSTPTLFVVAAVKRHLILNDMYTIHQL